THEKSSKFHSLIVLSPLPVARTFSSFANRTVHTPRLCPLHIPRSFIELPFLLYSISKILAVRSCEPETNRRLLGETSRELISLSCALCVTRLLHLTVSAPDESEISERSHIFIVRSWLPVNMNGSSPS